MKSGMFSSCMTCRKPTFGNMYCGACLEIRAVEEQERLKQEEYMEARKAVERLLDELWWKNRA